MATNGITFSGINGFDFEKIINIIMQQESQPLTALQGLEKTHKEKDAAFVELGGQISKLQDTVTKLIGANAFQQVAVESSDPSIVQATADAGAAAGSYTVDVSALAKAQVTASANGYSLATDIAANGGSISFTINGQTTQAIQITGDTTLSELRNLINAQNSGVVASIVNTGTDHRLIISSRKTGVVNGFTINNGLTHGGGTAVSFGANAQDAQDASLIVSGIPVTSASNQVTALSGLNLQLKKTGSVTIEATPDRNSLKETIKELVEAFNGLRELYSKAQKRGDNGQSAPLANDAVLRQIYSEIRSTLLGASPNGGDFTRLAEVGIEFAANGDLKFVESTFNSAMDTRLADLQELFQGVQGVGGVFRDLKTRLQTLDSTAGVIKTARNNLQTVLTKDRDRIEAQELRLALRRQELVKLYAAADEAIAQMNSATNAINSISRGLF
jgi:flagellar hook-associated protein 2